MVISLRSAVGMATIWVVAVAGVSGTAWLAIDRAGRDITNVSVSSLAPAPLATKARPKPTITTTTPAARAAPAPSVAAPPPAAPAPSATASTPTTHRRTASRPAPTLTPQDRTISVRGGQITVRCSGPRIRLQVAQPENEWRVQVDYPESGRIIVSFTMGDEEEAHRTQVTASCSRGVPGFDVRTR